MKNLAKQILGEAEEAPEERREVAVANGILQAVKSLPASDAKAVITRLGTELKTMHSK